MIGPGMATYVTSRTSTLTVLSTNTYVTRGTMKRSADQPESLLQNWRAGCPHAPVIRALTPKEDFQ